MNIDVKNLILEGRKKNNWTQSYIGTLLGVSKQTISKWEKGISQPSTSKLYEIIQLFGYGNQNIFNEDIHPTKFNKPYNIGLNVLFENITDYDTLIDFIDSFSVLRKLLHLNEYIAGYLLLNIDITNEKSHDEAIPLFSIGTENNMIVINDGIQKRVFTKDMIEYVEQYEQFNNAAYSFIIHLKDQSKIQIILDLEIQ